ncbi:hypothetical protein SRSM4_112 [Synechococcus phage S-RSM4]|uniref:Uncharacterized protein n=1 Tax=Synechococcus phage S-RSM4 TaxID=555387 RepID=C7BV80_9CAUD|nr:hypothetical protein SRSM4_112 [Synechococcus phage S-RSM4]CAR63309.1 hypothetical protein SRSM4_112 [Synechococcus phage S-RSM4]
MTLLTFTCQIKLRDQVFLLSTGSTYPFSEKKMFQTELIPNIHQ